jgi:hypothetical protein
MITSNLFAFAFSFSLLLAISFAAVCENPIYGDCFNKFCWAQSQTSPTAKPNTKVCPDIPVGSPSCCTNADYAGFALKYIITRDEVKANIDIHLALLKAYSSTENVDKLNQDLDKSDLTSDQKQAILTAYTNFYSAVNNFITTAENHLYTCADGILKYIAGFVCLSCRPDWSKYAYIDTRNYVSYILDPTTCTSLVSNCGDYVVSYVELVDTTIESFRTIADTVWYLNFTNGDGAPFSNTDLPCVNVTTCAEYICDRMAQGAHLDSIAGVNPDSSDSDSEGTARRQLSPTDFGQLMNAPFNIFGVQSTSSRSLRSTSGVNSNVYNSSGYAAYNNGANSGLSTDVSSSSTHSSASSLLQSWLSGLCLV